MILHDKIITKKEAKFMREIQKELEAHLNGVPKTF
jgi:hypothetical protein